MLLDLYLLSVVRIINGLHILSAEYNRRRRHHHHHNHHYHHLRRRRSNNNNNNNNNNNHELSLNRPISASSNCLFKGLPSRLLPFGLLFSIIFGILLMVILIYWFLETLLILSSCLCVGIPKSFFLSYVSHTCQLCRKSHPNSFYDRNITWWVTDISELFTLQFPASSWHFLSLGISPHHSVVKQQVSLFFA